MGAGMPERERTSRPVPVEEVWAEPAARTTDGSAPEGIFPCRLLLLGPGADEVQGRAGLEPLDLLPREGVLGRDPVLLAVLVLQDQRQRLAGRERREPLDRHPVVLADLLVVGRVLEGERQEPLL